MDSASNKADIESRLHETAEAMSERLASLQDEVSSSGDSLRRWIVRNPVKSVGGMLGLGLAVGLLFGGSRSRRRKRHAQLIDAYLKALRSEVEDTIAQGEEPGPALEEALRERVPLVVYPGQNGHGEESQGWGRYFFQEAAEIVVSTSLSLFVRDLVESLLSDVELETIIEEEYTE